MPPNLSPAMRLLWLIANKSHTAWEEAYEKHYKQDNDGADEVAGEFLVWVQGELTGYIRLKLSQVDKRG